MSDKFPNTCFERPTSCDYYDGVSKGKIESGKSLNSNLLALATEVDRVAEKIDSCGSCGDGVVSGTTSTSSDTDVTVTTPIQCISNPSSGIVGTPYSINVTPGTRSSSVEYDFSGSVPGDCEILRFRIEIEDESGRIIKSSSNVKDFVNLNPNQLPAYLNSEVIINTEAGAQTISGRTRIGNEDTSYTGNFTSIAERYSAPEKQSDLNTIFDSKICDLETRLASYMGSDILNLVNELRAEVESLRNQLSDAGKLSVSYQNRCDDCDPGTVTKTLSEALSEAADCCCDNNAAIQSNKNQIGVVQNQFQTINTGTTTTTNTGTGTTTSSTTYVRYCGDNGCTRVASGDVPNGVTIYEDSDTNCGGNCPGTTNPTPGDCEVVVQWDYVDVSCGFSINTVNARLNELISTVTTSNPDFLLTNGGNYNSDLPSDVCGIKVKITCASGAQTEYGITESTTAASDWIIANCPCVIEPETDPCININAYIIKDSTGTELVFTSTDSSHEIIPSTVEKPLPGQTITVDLTVILEDGTECDTTISHTEPETASTDLCEGVTCDGCRECLEGECGFLIEGVLYTNKIEATERCREILGDNATYNVTNCQCEEGEIIDPCEGGNTNGTCCVNGTCNPGTSICQEQCTEEAQGAGTVYWTENGTCEGDIPCQI